MTFEPIDRKVDLFLPHLRPKKQKPIRKWSIVILNTALIPEWHDCNKPQLLPSSLLQDGQPDVVGSVMDAAH